MISRSLEGYIRGGLVCSVIHITNKAQSLTHIQIYKQSWINLSYDGTVFYGSFECLTTKKAYHYHFSALFSHKDVNNYLALSILWAEAVGLDVLAKTFSEKTSELWYKYCCYLWRFAKTLCLVDVASGVVAIYWFLF